jgi:hypothetical protein
MTILLAMILACQSTPGETIRLLSEAIEKKDLAAIKSLAADRQEVDGLTQGALDEWLADADKEAHGHLSAALAAFPIFGVVSKEIDKLDVEYIFSVKDGIVRVEIELERIEGVWKVEEMEARWRDFTVEGENVVAEISPGAVMKIIRLAAAEKDFEKILDRLPEKQRSMMGPEAIEGIVLGEEKRMDGKWLATLAKFPDVREGKRPLVRLEIEMTLEVDGSGVSINANMVKEKGRWVMGGIDTRLQKELDAPPPEPEPGPEKPPEEKDPR